MNNKIAKAILAILSAIASQTALADWNFDNEAFDIGWENPSATVQVYGESVLSATRDTYLKFTVTDLYSLYNSQRLKNATNTLYYLDSNLEKVKIGEITGVGQEFYAPFNAPEEMSLFVESEYEGVVLASNRRWTQGLGWSAESAGMFMQYDDWPDGFRIGLNIAPTTPPPAGQPLPAVALSAAFAALGAGFLKLRKKKGES